MDLKLADGRTLHCYDSGDIGGLTVFWHHGSPNTGMPPEPLFPAAAERGIRWVSYDRPGYMSSTARPGRARRTAVASRGRRLTLIATVSPPQSRSSG